MYSHQQFSQLSSSVQGGEDQTKSIKGVKIKNWAYSGKFDLTLGKETKEKVGGAQFQRLGDKKVYDWQNTFSMFWHILAKYLNGKLCSKKNILMVLN